MAFPPFKTGFAEDVDFRVRVKPKAGRSSIGRRTWTVCEFGKSETFAHSFVFSIVVECLSSLIGDF
jgi:hypothetical protein